MCRLVVALVIVIASATTSWAQTFRPSMWRSERGAILKVLNIDPATGAFAGVFISSPTGACPAVPYDLTGRVQLRQRRVAFTTSRTWTSDCAVTTFWSGRAIGGGAAAVTWRSRAVGPDGRAVWSRGTEVFTRI
jgi:hypothetical protein